MTEESKNAVLGRLTKEQKENKEHIGRLAAEASRWGQRLTEIGGFLRSKPESLVLNGQSLDLRYRKNGSDFSPNDLNVEGLTALTNDYREALLVRDRLVNQIAQLGFSIS
ncbi:MAG: hypothetical protein WB795_18515 [Candidatus Acidiferrales bacterium]